MLRLLLELIKITNASSTEKIDRFLKRLLFMYRDDIAKELGLTSPDIIVEGQVLDLSKVDWSSKTFGKYIGNLIIDGLAHQNGYLK